jgi:hypothetical protein
MRKQCVILLVLGTIVVLLPTSVFAGSFTFSLIPISGDVSGPAGSTVGWGYTLTNDTALWIQPMGVSAGAFQNGTPNLIFDFPAVGPNSFVTLDFSLVPTGSCASPPCGFYELTWDSDAPSGFMNNGTFTISSDYYSCDPSQPGCNDLGAAPDASADYSATVSGGPVPEPSTVSVLISGLAGMTLMLNRRRRHLRP